jgi:uncharacterized damage-inducible protein DinB
MSLKQRIDDYITGPAQLRRAIDGMSAGQLDARPIAGKWSTREVICHLADFEPVYVDRMKRVIAEDKPTFFGGDPDVFAARLAYSARDLDEELRLIEACRAHLGRILAALAPGDFQRTGTHSENGPLTLEQLLTNITAHLPHHIRFIDEKRAALAP